MKTKIMRLALAIGLLSLAAVSATAQTFTGATLKNDDTDQYGTFNISVSFSGVSAYYAATNTTRFAAVAPFTSSVRLAPQATKDFSSEITLHVAAGIQAAYPVGIYGFPTNQFFIYSPSVTSSTFEDPPYTGPYEATPPAGSDETTTVGSNWTPSISGGVGGSNIFCVMNYTNWQSESWSPTGVGTYQFWVGLLPDSTHYGNVSGTNLGTISTTGTLYTLTVTSPMESPTGQNESTSAAPWTPSISGGTGVDQYIFCVPGYTNWQTGSWTPPGPGTYQFWVGALPATYYFGNVTGTNYPSIQTTGTLYTLTVP